MANKKYYWLKLKTDFFSQKSIKKLRKIAGGDTYTIIYLKLQLLSLKDNAKLFFEGFEDTFIEEIALEIDEEVENVRVTVMFLIKFGLLEEINDTEFLLTETKESIGSETQGAARVRRHREKQKVLQSNTPVTFCNTEIEKEIEKEIEIENREDTEIEKESPFIFWNNNFHPITFYEKEQLISYLEDEIEPTLLTHCLEIAVSKNIRTLNYVKGILNKYLKKNITTLKAALSADEEFKRGKENGKAQSNGNYKADTGEVERDGRWDEYTG